MSTNQRQESSLPRVMRIRSRKDFARVFRNRTYLSDEHIILYAVANGEEWSRVGISVGRRIGNAVQRNRCKRLIREAFRRQIRQLPVGIDWVVIPKPGHEPSFFYLEKSISQLANRLGQIIYRKEHQKRL